MPWLEVDDPYARPPKIPAVDPSGFWDGELLMDGDWAELADLVVRQPVESWPAELRELSLLRCRLDGTAFETDTTLTIEAQECHVVTADLSAAAVQTFRSLRIESSKLIGTDFSGASLKNVEFVQCNLRYANFRMAKLDRVRFVDCTLDEIDAFQADFRDVEFPGSELTSVNVDRLTAERVDLRGAASVELRAVSSLKGCLISEYQIPALAYSLVAAVGLDIEKVIEKDIEKVDGEP